MSGSESGNISPVSGIVRAPPPPPRIRPESPLSETDVIGDVEAGSDISSVSDFHDEVDKLEAVSDNELSDDNLSWTEDKLASKDVIENDENSKASGPIVDLEDIESDEDLPEPETKTESAKNNDSVITVSPKNGHSKLEEDHSPKKVSFCRQCRLLFVDETALASHGKTEAHRFVLSGFKPSNGSHYCVICWCGHKTADDLEEHMNSKEHKAETEKHRVLKFNYNPPEVSPKPEVLAEVVKSRSISPNLKRSRSKSNSGGPQPKVQRTYPPPLNDFYGGSSEDFATSDFKVNSATICDDSDICDKCNLVFASAYYSKLHLSSQSHKSVVEGRLPSSGQNNSNCSQHFSCLVCWVGFTRDSELRRHVAHKCHSISLKKHGVSHFLHDVSQSPIYNRPSNDVKCDGKYIPLTDYIVLDEVGESDDDEGVNEIEQCRPTTDAHPKRGSPRNAEPKDGYVNGNVADQLDNISSDEEVNNSLAVSSSNPQPLEDVDSDDDLGNSDLNEAKNKDPFNDNISSDEELNRSLAVPSSNLQPLEDVDSDDDLGNISLSRNLNRPENNILSGKEPNNSLVVTSSSLQPLEDVDSEDDLDNDYLSKDQIEYNNKVVHSDFNNLETSHLESLSDDDMEVQAPVREQQTISKCEQARADSIGNESSCDASQQDQDQLLDPLSETELVSETGDTDIYIDELDYDEGHA